MSEDFYVYAKTECCQSTVEISVGEEYLLEDFHEVICPLCGKLTNAS